MLACSPSLSLPFKQSSSTSRKGPSSGSASVIAPHQVATGEYDGAESTLHALPSTLLPSPSTSSSPSASTAAPSPRRTMSTPPSAHGEGSGITQTVHRKESRKSFLRSTSRTSLKRVFTPSSAPTPASNDVAQGAPDISCSTSTPSTSTSTPQKRPRRKSIKEILTLPMSFMSSSSGSHPPSSPSDSQGDSDAKSTLKTKRRYSIASSPSSSSSHRSSATSPTSPPIRKSTSNATFRQNKEQSSDLSSEMFIPPVPALPAHLSLESISPIYSSSKRTSTLHLPSPKTPTTSSTSSIHLATPNSAKSASSSSSFSSSQNGTSSTSLQFPRSSSVPALYTSSGLTASPSSSIGTLATPQTVDLRSSQSTSPGFQVQQQPSAMKKQQLSPLLLGPCLSDTLLSSDTLHTAEILRSLHERNGAEEEGTKDRKESHEVKSDEDGYGSEDGEGAGGMSTESDGYGAASDFSHTLVRKTSQGPDSLKQPQPSTRQENLSRRGSTASTLRVDTSLAAASSSSLSSPSSVIKRSSAYLSGNVAGPSLSPHSQSFLSTSTYTSQDLPSSSSISTSSLTTYRRTPTPTQNTAPIPSSSPRALSQGAKICMDYTILRLKKDGSSSPSTQPEKVNLPQMGGRRYPSSTRTLCSSPLHTPNAIIQSTITEQQQRQRREPRSASMAKELAWYGIVRKLYTRRRMTLMEEVELDGFKRLQANWTPCSSPLAGDFSLSSSTTSNVNAKVSGAPPLVASSGTDVRDGPYARDAAQNANQGKDTSIANLVMRTTAAQPSPLLTRQSLPPPPSSTSALVPGAFLRAQQVAWQKWLSRRSFEERMIITLQEGEHMAIVPELKARLVFSDRVHVWASATLEESYVISKDITLLDSGAVVSEFQQVPPRAGASIPSPPAAVLSEVPPQQKNNKNASVTHLKAESETAPFARNRISMAIRRVSSSDETAFQNKDKPESSAVESPQMITGKTNNGNVKTSFGYSLAAKLGFRSGKSKAILESSNNKQERNAIQTVSHLREQQESSSGSSLATTTSKSTPATSASSACSDQTDVDLTIKAKTGVPDRPTRPDRSTLRPPREQPPSSMVRSASQDAPFSHISRPTSMLLNSQSRSVPGLTVETLSPAQSRSPMPKSQSERRLSTHHPREVSGGHVQSRRLSKLEYPTDPQAQQRRVRVLSQPEGAVSARPHSMYTQSQIRAIQGQQDVGKGKRPTSQLLEVPRPKSLAVPSTQRNQARNPPNASLLGPRNHPHHDAQPVSGDRDDDETPLAVLKQTGRPALHSSTSEHVGAPEGRPRLRSAMRSSSQPRPTSMLSSASRNSVVLAQDSPYGSRSSSPARNRISVHDAGAANGRESWMNGEEVKRL